MQYHGQYFQDMIIDNYFHYKRNGSYVDIGAHDGITISNTYFLDHQRNWSGFCIEPIECVFKQLCENRPNAHKINCLVGSESTIKQFIYAPDEDMLSGRADTYHAEHFKRIKTNVRLISLPQYTLNDILSIDKRQQYDLLSIDTEGSEYDIIKAIDFDKYQFNMIFVENPYTAVEKCPIYNHLIPRDYIYIGRVYIDDLYIHKAYRIPVIKYVYEDISSIRIIVYEDGDIFTICIHLPKLNL